VKHCWLLPTPSQPPSCPSSSFALSASTAPLWLYPRAPQFPPLGPAADLPDLRRSLLEEKRKLHPFATRHAKNLNRALLPPTTAYDAPKDEGDMGDAPKDEGSMGDAPADDAPADEAPPPPQTLIARPATAASSFHLARVVTNPFDDLTTKKGVSRRFVNRSAVKLANVDALLDGLLSKAGGRGGLKFVDLCGAPGGFSEYLLHRCSRNGRPAHGWGMSLAGENGEGSGAEWKLDHLMEHMQTDADVQYRCCYGADGTGDIYDPANVRSLAAHVLADSGTWPASPPHVPPGKAQLVVCDGGFDAQRDVEDQEARALRLVACQGAAAVRLLSAGGVLLLKYFGAAGGTAKVLKVLASCFMRTLVVKPVSSRPASAERYGRPERAERGAAEAGNGEDESNRAER
jgi:cap1 methyltransferase